MAILVLAIACAGLATVLGAMPAAAQGGLCDTTPYIMQDNQLFQVVPDPANPGEFVLSLVNGGSFGNSLAYDATNDTILGIRRTGNSSNRTLQVETYDTAGNTLNQQTVFPGPGQPVFPNNSSMTSYSGTALGDGTYIIGVWAATGGDQLWSVDPATGEATYIGPSPSPRHADFAYNPADGYIYHANRDNIYQINPLTGAEVIIGAATGIPTSGGYGSSWFDAAGNLYIQRNSDGAIFQVNVSTLEGQLVGATGRVRGADAASCVGSLDLLKDVVDAGNNPIDPEDRIYAPGEVIRYEFTLINNALPTGPLNLELCDTLPAGFTAVGSSDGQVPVGSNTFCVDVLAPSTLFTDPNTPGSPPTKYYVDVQVPENAAPGEYGNQATMEGTILSDDPGDVSDPEDPTPVMVTGEFFVGKTVDGHPDAQDTDTFTFTISCVDAEGVAFDVPATSIVDASDIQWSTAATNTFTVTDDDVVTVQGLPADAVCTATESVADGYAATFTSSDGVQTDTSATMTIDAPPGSDGTKVQNLTSTYSIEKTASGPDGVAAAPLDVTGTFTFDVVCTLGGDTVLEETVSITTTGPADGPTTGSAEWNETSLVPAGAECTVTENPAPGWTSSGPVTFTAETDEDARAEFKNVRQIANLTIDKEIVAPAGVDPADFTFEVSVVCSGGFDPEPVTFGPFDLVVGTSTVLEGLPVGATCVATEASADGFTSTVTPDGGKVAIEEDGAQVDFTNTTSTIEINKVATSVAASDLAADFTFTVSCSNGYSGTHTVTTDGAGAGATTYPDIPPVEPGTTCDIEELVTDGWTVTSPNTAATSPAGGETGSVTFSNIRTVVEVDVTKTVTGLPDGKVPSDYSFDITITCTGGGLTAPIEVVTSIDGGETVTVPDVPTGAVCAVVEDEVPEFTTTYDPGPVEVTERGGELGITNATGTFSILKTTRVNSLQPIDPTDTFTFVVECDNGFSDTVVLSAADMTAVVQGATGSIGYPTLPLIGAAVSCDVTEVLPEDWTLVSPETVTVGVDETAEFRNLRDLATLTVEKTIDGLPGGEDPADYTFDITVTCTDGGLTETVTVEAEIAGDGSVVIADLPTGAACSVVEAETQGFFPTYDPASVVLSGDPGSDVLGITNTTGVLFIAKTTVVPSDQPIDPTGTFEFLVECDNGYADTLTLAAADMAAVGAGATGGIGYDEIPLLATGTTCTVTEQNVPTGWMLTPPGPVVVVIDNGDPATAEFTNTREVADLMITKTVVGLPDGEDPKDYKFDVTVECTGGDLTETVIVVAGITDGFTIPVPDLPTGATCTIVESVTQGFTPIYTAESVTIDEDGVEVGITNSTGTFSIVKSTEVPSDLSIDSTGTFTFLVECSNGFSDTFVLAAADMTVAGAAASGSIAYPALPIIGSDVTCDVTEQTPPAGWTLASAPTVNVGVDGVAEFDNTRDVATLTVNKTIEGLPAGEVPGDYTFDITVTCTDGNLTEEFVVEAEIAGDGTVTVPGLPTGADCSVVEAVTEGFTPTYAPASVVISGDPDADVLGITNSTGTFSIVKTTNVASDQPIDPTGTFTFLVECSNGFTDTFVLSAADMVAGVGSATGSIANPVLPIIGSDVRCGVTEQTPPTGWTLASEPTVTVGVDGVAEFTNTRDVADLTVNKTIEGLPDGEVPADYTFDITVTCADGDLTETVVVEAEIAGDGTMTVPGLPTGAECSVVEEFTQGFTPTYTPGSVVISGDSDADVLGITNRTGVLFIAKSTVVPSGQPIDPTGEFVFGVVCSNGYSDTLTLAAADMTVDGASATGGIGYDAIPLLADGTTCVVTEQTPPTGWTLTSPNNVGLTVDFENLQTAEFTNTRDVADLTINKTIEGLPAGELPADYTFDITVTCTDGNLTETVVVEAEIAGDGTVTVPGLPTGAECSVVEEFTQGFTPTYTPGSVVISGDPDADVLGITNRTGVLFIAKSTVVPSGQPIDPTGTFVFDVVCSNGYSDTLTLAAADMTVDGASATGGIGYDAIPLLADGTTCVVTEQTPPTGWTLTSPNNVGLTVDYENLQTAEFTNTRDVADLTINKTIEGLPDGELPADYSFDITVTCTDGNLTETVIVEAEIAGDGTVTVPGLPTGADCSVVEAVTQGFTPTYTPASVVMSGDPDADVLGITNRTGVLFIAKSTVVPSGQPIDPTGTFVFDVVCSNGYSDTLTLAAADMTADGVSATGGIGYDSIPLLADGTTCTVTEQTPPTGWTLTSPNDVGLTVDYENLQTAEFTNTRDVADLTVNKTIEGLPDGEVAADYTFDITVTCTDGNLAETVVVEAEIAGDGTVTVPGLPTGANCSVVEEITQGFTPTYTPASVIISGDPDIDVLGITNRTGVLFIAKTTVVPSGQPIDPTGTFVFDVVCSNGYSDTLTLLAADMSVDGASATGGIGYDAIPLLADGTTCTVTEQTPPTGWTLTSLNDVPLTVDYENLQTAEFTNTRDVADLTINKTIEGLPDGELPEDYTFDITVTCTDGNLTETVVVEAEIAGDGTVTVPGLPTGADCSVEEEITQGFTPTYTPASVVIAGDADADVLGITNRTGVLFIAKTTVVPSGQPIDPTGTFVFDVVCSNGYSDTLTLAAADMTVDGASATGGIGYDAIPLLADGTTCTVTEQTPPAGWTLTSPNDVPLTVDYENLQTAEFTNTRDVADLTINKTIEGLPVGELPADYSFDITVTCIDGNLTETVVVEAEIAGDGTVMVPGLPTAADCSVTEAVTQGFTPTYTPASVTISGDADADVLGITNRTGVLFIAKSTNVPSGQPIDPTGTFVFDIVCSNGYSDTLTLAAADMMVDGARATGGIGYDAIPLLADGTTCTVTEQTPPTGWSLTSSNDVRVTVDYENLQTAEFTNTRDVADLTINKTIEGLPAGELPADYTFDITVTCLNGNLTETVVTGAEISGDGTVTVPGLPTGAECSVVEETTQGFTPTYTPGSVIISGDPDTDVLGITNRTGVLFIAKTTVVPSGQPIDPTGTFVFDVVCSNGYSDMLTLAAADMTVAGASATGGIGYDSIPLLADGTTCTVTEQTPPAGWALTSPNDVGLTVDYENLQTAEFTNTRDVADLTINKTIEGLPDGEVAVDYSFDITVTCTDGNLTETVTVQAEIAGDGTVTVPGLPTGADCSVEEEITQGFTPTYTPASVTISGDADADVLGITNRTGVLFIAKSTVVPSGQPIDPTGTFVFDVVCSNGYSDTLTLAAADMTVDGAAATGGIGYDAIPLLADGTTCTVTEQTPPAGWTLTSPNDVGLTVDYENLQTAEFTNTRDVADLTINKTIQGLPDGELPADYSFDITVTCIDGNLTETVTVEAEIAGDGTVTVPGLPTGADCSVVEEITQGFTPTYTPASVVIAGDADADTLGITNSTGTFSIVKTTNVPSGQPIDPTGTFSFLVECSNGFTDTFVLSAADMVATGNTATGSIANPVLPIIGSDVTCAVSEQAPPAGWTLSSAASVAVGVDGVAEFTNTRDVADLTINKTIEGLPDGEVPADYTFDIIVTCIDGNLTGTVTVEAEIAGDGTVTVPGLPTGAECSVVEEITQGFTPTYEPSSVTISGDADADTLGITNRTGVLFIAKSTVVPSGQPIDPTGEFVFDVVCSNGYSDTLTLAAADMTVDGATATGGIGYDAIPLLADGTTCIVTEQTPPFGWALTSPNDVPLTVDYENLQTAEFTNTRDVADLTISKTIEGLPAGELPEDYTFDITVTCTGGTLTETVIVEAEIAGDGTVTVPGLPTGADCSVVEEITQGFTPTYEPSLVTISGDADADTLGITNRTGVLFIAKSTVVPSGQPIDPTGTFVFDVVCSNGYSDTLTLPAAEMTASGATATGGIGYDAIPLLADGTTCVVTEQTPPTGWTLTSPNDVGLTVDYENLQTAEFTNTRDVANLTINKTIEGLPDGEVPADYSFDITVTCTDGNLTETVTVEAEIAGDGTVTVPGLPTGADCSVTEAVTQGFTPTYTPASVVISGDPDADTLGITNSTGTFSIVKTTNVASDQPIDPTGTFTFLVECSNGFTDTFVLAAADMVATGNTATGSIANPVLPIIGSDVTCAVSEQAPPAGWTLSSAPSVAVGVDGVAEFTNTRDVADLTINKTIEGLPAGELAADYAFDITVTCTDGNLTETVTVEAEIAGDGTVTVPGLPTGAECSVVEEITQGFTPTYEPSSVTISGDPDADTLGITNRTGVLFISKSTVVPSGQPIDPTGTFVFDVVCSNGYSDTLTLLAADMTVAGASATGGIGYDAIPLLADGTTCTVTEQTPPFGWALTSSNDVPLTVDYENLQTAEFTNTRDVANLTISKTIEGLPDGELPEDYIFDITVTCTDGNLIETVVVEAEIAGDGTVTVPGLPTGADCSVVEAVTQGFTPTYTPASVIISGDPDTDVLGITNRTGVLFIAKSTVVPSGQPIDPTGTFVFDVVCSNGYSDTLTLLAADMTVAGASATGGIGYDAIPLLADGTTCTVTEQTPPFGWALTSSNDVPLTVDYENLQTAEFTNTRDVADLTISKTIEGLPAGELPADYIFNITVTCTDGNLTGTVTVEAEIAGDGTVTVPGLPTGADCSVIEEITQGFTPTYTPASVVISGDADADTLGITNRTGVLFIAKSTVVPSGQPIDPTGTFVFDVTCSNGYSDTLTLPAADMIVAGASATGGIGYDSIPLLADGTTCTVAEQTPPTGWTLTSPNDVGLTVDYENLQTAEFTNTRDVANLTINKTIEGLPDGEVPAAYMFDITVTCTDGDLTETVIVGAKIAGDGTVTVPGLPTGADCSVIEEITQGFTPTYTPASVVISGDADADVLGITNRTGVLFIAKTTIVPSGQPIDPTGTFVFDVVCSNGYSDTLTLAAADMTVDGAAATGGIGYDAIPLLADGTTCTVTEQTPPTGWTLTSPNDVGVTVDYDNLQTAEFTNTRDVADLTVNKTIEGLPDGELPEDYVFDITVTCLNGNLTETVVTDAEISGDGTVTVPGLPTGANCSVVEAFTAGFTPSYSPSSLVIAGEANADTIAITNSTGTFSIVKTTNVRSDQPIDPTGTFTFLVGCSNGFTDAFVLSAADMVVNGNTATGSITNPVLPIIGSDVSCAVIESPAQGWTRTSDATVTVGVDGVAQFTNTRDVADLTINKTIEGLPDGELPEGYTFDITVTCLNGDLSETVIVEAEIAGDGTVTVPGLPTGAECSVVEEVTQGFTPTYEPASVVVSGDADADTLGITNRTGVLFIAKTTVVPSGQPIDPTGTFVFDVACSNGYSDTLTLAAADMTVDGASATGGIGYDAIPLLADGTTCTVTEQTPPTGWTLTSPNDVGVTVDYENLQTAEFTNTRDVADLTVNKTIEGLPAGELPEDYTFEITVTCLNGDLSETVIVEAEIAGDGTVTVPGLPTGAECSVVEEVTQGFTPTYEPASVVVSGDADADTLGITNRTGVLFIAKSTIVPSGQPIDPTGTFVFDVACSNGYSDTLTLAAADMIVDGATATGGIGYDAIPLLADGTTCTVTEQTPPTGWTLTSPNDVGLTVDYDNLQTAEFTNTRDVADLTINKTIEGLPAGELPGDYTFEISITCLNGNLTATVIVDARIAGDGTVTVPGLPTGANCSVVEAFTEGFTPTYAPASLTISGNPAADTIAITNSTGTFSIVKTTNVPSDQPTDPTGTFTFLVVCSNGFTDTVTLNAADMVATGNTATGSIANPVLPIIGSDVTCVITEQTPPTGWTLDSDPTVTVGIDGIAQFENVRDVGTLTVNKTIVGLPEGELPESYTFDITVTCTDGGLTGAFTAATTISGDGTVQIPDLPTGANCSVIETATSGFAASYSAESVVISGDAALDTIGITNATGVLFIKKIAIIPAATPIDPTANFEWSVVCSNGYSDTLVLAAADMTAAAASASGGIGYDAIPLLADGTTCTVTEQNLPAGWTLTSDNDVIVTINNAAPVTAEFTNTRELGVLTVTKAIVGLPDGEVPEDYSLSIDVTCTGGGLLEPITTASLISGNGKYVVPDLPTGASCSVAETATQGFTPSYSAESVVITGDAALDTIGITNTTGVLFIAKTTIVPSGESIDPTGTFEWLVVCSNGYSDTLVLSAADMTGVGPSATGGIGYDAIPLLADGTTCTVTEQNVPTGWTLTSDNDVVVTIDSADPATAEFTNTRDVAALTITKTIVGLPEGETPTSYSFDITVVCTGGGLTEEFAFATTISGNGTATVPGLPTGANCSVEEAQTEGFTPSYSAESVVITGDAALDTIGITNTTGVLFIAKTTAVASVQPIDPTGTFEWFVSCDNGYSDTLVLAAGDMTVAGGSATGGVGYDAIPLLADGTACTVTEQNVPAGWTLTSGNDVVVVIDSANPATAAFTNTRDVAALTITKTIVGLPDGESPSSYVFDITVTCSDGNLTETVTVATQIAGDGTVTVPDLPTGATCSVQEAVTAGFAPSYSPASVVIDADGEAIAITNTTGVLFIAKTTIVPSGHPIEPTDTFEWFVACSDGWSDTLVLNAVDMWVIPGGAFGGIGYDQLPLFANGTTCTVTEQNVPTGWGLTSDNDVTVTVDYRDLATAKFTNTREVADLTITKSIVGLPEGEAASSWAFDIAVTCTDGDLTETVTVRSRIAGDGTVKVADLPTGANCFVEEAQTEGFTPSYSAESVVITGDAALDTIGITNTTGVLFIAKTTAVASGQPIDPTGTFEWFVSCDNGFSDTLVLAAGDMTVAGGSATGGVGYDAIPLLADGTACTVTEQNVPAGWTLTSGNDVVVVIHSANPATAAFTNTRQVSDLTITKTIVGLPDGERAADYVFDITVTCTDGNLTETVTVATQIAGDGTVTVPDLPTGATCSVQEAVTAGFAPSYSPASVVIDADGEAIAITNTTGVLFIAKTTTIVSDQPIDPTGRFEWAVTCSNGYVDVLVLDAADMAVSGFSAFGGIGYDEIPLLADGTTCTITEQNLPAGWTLRSANNVVVTIDSSDPVTAQFSNSRDVAPLTVTKTIVGLPADQDPTAYSFPITVTCTGGDLTVPVVVDAVIASGGIVTVPGLPTGADCAVVETPSDAFTVTYSTGSVAITPDGAVVGITNTFDSNTVSPGASLHTLTITKEIVGADDRDQEQFDIIVFCSGGTDLTVSETVSVAEPVVLTDLPSGTSCVVVEEGTPLYTTTYVPSNQKAEISGADASVTIVNTLNDGPVVTPTPGPTLVPTPVPQPPTAVRPPVQQIIPLAPPTPVPFGAPSTSNSNFGESDSGEIRTPQFILDSVSESTGSDTPGTSNGAVDIDQSDSSGDRGSELAETSAQTGASSGDSGSGVAQTSPQTDGSSLGTPAPDDQLAFTGPSPVVVHLGFGLVVLGVLLIAIGRRREDHLGNR